MTLLSNTSYDAKRTKSEYLRASIFQENVRFEQALICWRTGPIDDKKEKTLSQLIDDHHAQVVEIQQLQIAQLLDSYERYEGADAHAVAF